MQHISVERKLNPQLREQYEHEARGFGKKPTDVLTKISPIIINIKIEHLRLQSENCGNYMSDSSHWQAWAITESGLHRALMAYPLKRFQRCNSARLGGASVETSENERLTSTPIIGSNVQANLAA